MDTVKKRRKFDIINYIPVVAIAFIMAVIIILICILASGNDKAIKLNDLKKLPFATTDTFVPFADGAAYIDESKGELYYVDDRNEIMWGFSGAVEGMTLYPGTEKLAVTVGRKLQVINKNGTLVFTKEFEKTVSGVAVGEKLIAVSLSDSDDTIILNGTGEEIDRIVSAVNNTNIRFGVFDTSSIWVITVENSGYNPEYRLSTYKYDTGKTQTVTFTEDSQMMYDAVFCDNLCYIFGTERLMVRDCDYTGLVNEDHNVNGYDVISYGKIKRKMHVLLANNGRLKAIGENGMMNIECEEKISFAAVGEKNYYAFSEYFMYKLKPKTGKATKYRFPVRVDDVAGGDGYVLISSGNDVYRFGLNG